MKRNPLPMSQDPGHNWKAANGGKRQLGKHAGHQGDMGRRTDWQLDLFWPGEKTPYRTVTLENMTKAKAEAEAKDISDREVEGDEKATEGPSWTLT